MKYFNIYVVLLFVSFISCKEKNALEWQIKSPDEKINIVIHNTNDDKNLLYSVNIKDEDSLVSIVKNSTLGLETKIGDFGKKLTFLSRNDSINQDENYKLISGNKDLYNNPYNLTRLKFVNENDETIVVCIKVFNNGIAFRYEFPDLNKKTVVYKELTSFNFDEGKFWGHAYDTITDWSPAYETYYHNNLAIGTKPPKGKNGWSFPLLFNTNNHWALISESGFDGSYAASHIDENSDGGNYKLKFAENNEIGGLYNNVSLLNKQGKTPWRFITISKNLSGIVESHMVTDLAKPNKLGDIKWVKPGRSSWSWWSESNSSKEYKSLKLYVDLASDMGWEYSLVDANWNNMAGGSLTDLIQYANSKEVCLLVWYNSAGNHNQILEEPRNLLMNSESRRKEFKRIRDLGVCGIKVDFFLSDKQKMIQYYLDILKDAAEFQLLVNFHGCTLPKGWRRTYPNLLTMEAIKGAEAYKYIEDFPSKAPSHITTIPFLRGVVGPTDYTPLTFSNAKYPHLTTSGFELALPIIIESGIIHYAENYKIINSQPEFVKEFLKQTPAVWDEIKLIGGYPGKDVFIAKRKDEKWYLAGINGENTEKTIDLDLSRLQVNGSYLKIITDDSFLKDKLKTESIKIINKKTSIILKPYGGFVGEIIFD